MTESPARDLVEAFLAAYGPYVRTRVPGSVPDLGGALAAGETWLEGELVALLDLPFAEQRRGPLEVFQEAMRFPTDALGAAGVAPAERDPVAEAALPGDVYGLAPASSRDLGEEAWMAHLRWGAAKAAAMAADRSE